MILNYPQGGGFMLPGRPRIIDLPPLPVRTGLDPVFHATTGLSNSAARVEALLVDAQDTSPGVTIRGA
ncbi:hypothetical protein [Parapedomonas caeni]